MSFKLTVNKIELAVLKFERFNGHRDAIEGIYMDYSVENAGFCISVTFHDEYYDTLYIHFFNHEIRAKQVDELTWEMLDELNLYLSESEVG